MDVHLAAREEFVDPVRGLLVIWCECKDFDKSYLCAKAETSLTHLQSSCTGGRRDWAAMRKGGKRERMMMDEYGNTIQLWLIAARHSDVSFRCDSDTFLTTVVETFFFLVMEVWNCTGRSRQMSWLPLISSQLIYPVIVPLENVLLLLCESCPQM